MNTNEDRLEMGAWSESRATARLIALFLMTLPNPICVHLCASVVIVWICNGSDTPKIQIVKDEKFEWRKYKASRHPV